MTPSERPDDEYDDGVLRLRSGDMLVFDHFAREVRVCPSVEFASEAVFTLPRAQQAAIALAAQAEAYRDALCELHRAVSDHDGSDADDARLADAVKAAQEIAPYQPELDDVDGF